MLGQLHIKNIGIIDDIVINFEDGLNILTGETGAGKSLIIGSISAVTGNRISKEIIKTGKDMALIEACFFTKDDSVIISREIYENGRNICKVNGKMVTLGDLKEISKELIDIHGQHDNQSLLNPSAHLKLLDKFIGKDFEDIKSEYTKLLEEYKQTQKELDANFGDEKDRARRIDLLKYQVEEIINAKLIAGEEEELNKRRELILNSEKIAKSLSNAYNNLNDIVVDNLGLAVHELSSIATLDENYDKILLNLNEAYYTLKDAASDTLSCMNNVEFDEREQDQIEERLDLIYSLKRKYGSDIESILKYLDEITFELERLQNSDEIRLELKNKLDKLEIKLTNLAKEMSKQRKAKAIIICDKVNKELNDLEMKKAHIEFEFIALDKFTSNGLDDAQILITTNVGESAKPLSKIASGGEISRVMLALKTVFSEYDDIESMIFDEIDTGISGQAGKVVAQKMKAISASHQLICITHLPVIAAMGDSNYFIAKDTKDDKTYTTIAKLDETQTINEIARILDGDNVSKVTLDHAKALRKLK